MTLQIELLDLVKAAFALAVVILGGYAALSRLLLVQIEKRLDQRFESHDKADAQERERIAARLATTEREVNTNSSALARIEGARTDGPTHKDLGEIHERINDLSEQVSETRGEFAAARRMLETIHEFLLRTR